MVTTVYLETFSETGIVGGALPTLEATVAPLTGPSAVAPSTCERLSLSGTGYLYNDSTDNTSGETGFAIFQVTVPPMAEGSVTMVGVSQRDISGFIPASVGTIDDGGSVVYMAVTASNNFKFFGGGYSNVKAKDSPAHTALAIGRQFFQEVNDPGYVRVSYPVSGDPIQLRMEFTQAYVQTFVNGVSVGIQSHDGAGALFDTFRFDIFGQAGLSSIQIDQGLFEPGGPRPGADIPYPGGLPGPISAPYQPADRRMASNLPGARNLRALSRDRQATQELQFWFSHEQCAVFTDWLENTLIDSGAWFYASWPIPQGGVGVRRFIGEPSYPKFHPGFGWLINATCEVRGRGALPRQSLGE